MPTDEEEFGAETEEPVSNEEISPTGEIIRVRTPRGREVLGILDQRLGASRMKVRCMDGKTRVCRVPGRLKRKLWLRPDDVVIVSPWDLDKNKGDVIFKYRSNQIEWLKKQGYLETEKSEF